MEEIQKCIEDRLLGCNESRTYYTQTLLPGMALPISLEEDPTKGSKGTKCGYTSLYLVKSMMYDQLLHIPYSLLTCCA